MAPAPVFENGSNFPEGRVAQPSAAATGRIEGFFTGTVAYEHATAKGGEVWILDFNQREQSNAGHVRRGHTVASGVDPGRCADRLLHTGWRTERCRSADLGQVQSGRAAHFPARRPSRSSVVVDPDADPVFLAIAVSLAVGTDGPLLAVGTDGPLLFSTDRPEDLLDRTSGTTEAAYVVGSAPEDLVDRLTRAIG